MARSCIPLLWCHQMTIFQGSITTQLLWKMLTSLKTSMQMNRSWLRGAPLSQSHWYFSPVFACALHPRLAAAAPCAAAPYGAFCHPPWGSGPGLGNSPREKSNITAQQGEFCFPCSFTTLEQVFLCCCFIRHPITSCLDLSHLAAGKYAFWIAHIYCDLYAQFPQEKSCCDIVASFQV